MEQVTEQCQVHAIGAAVKLADALLVIVPEQSGLVVEANVLNRDVGFVREGQDVRVKLVPSPFTRYGIVEGKLAFLSRNAIMTRNGVSYSRRGSSWRIPAFVLPWIVRRRYQPEWP
jgi:multidrug resistance efflux pump